MRSFMRSFKALVIILGYIAAAIIASWIVIIAYIIRLAQDGVLPIK